MYIYTIYTFLVLHSFVKYSVYAVNAAGISLLLRHYTRDCGVNCPFTLPQNRRCEKEFKTET